jgi:hypothetical protein
VTWMAFLFAVFMFLGLRDRSHRGSTHLTILVVTTATLAYVFLGLGKGG